MFALLLAAIIVAKPIGDPASWITAEDYPVSAIKADVEGAVSVALQVDSSGTPQDCSIRTSSGNSDLDALTCELLLKRARYAPPRDDQGRPTTAAVVHQVRWAIPRDKLISQGFRMIYSLDDAGHIKGCKIEEFGAHDADLTCSSQMIEQLAGSSLSKPLTAYSQLSILLAMQVEDDAQIMLARPDRAERHILMQARIKVGPTGLITDCQSEPAIIRDGRPVDLCAGPVRIGEREFASDPAGRERTFVVSFEVLGEER